MEIEQPYILILGGTNFMGKTFLEDLTVQMPNAHVFCINRGKVYWNNEARKKCKFKNYLSDRKDHKDSGNMIKYLCQKLKISETKKWTAVVDFCGFKWRDVQSAHKAFGTLCEKYIFISSDSLYNNTDKQRIQLPLHEQHFDMQREYARQRSSNVQINDRYGYLRSQVPTISLRLPDVIGPYDNTERFWTTLEWIKKSNEHPIPLSADDESHKISLVFSQDVSKVLINLIKDPTPAPSSQYNLAFSEYPTVEQFLKLIGKYAEHPPCFRAVKQQSNICYPSTQFGTISIERAVRQIGFKPTSLQSAVKTTVKFFTECAGSYSKERGEMQRMLNKKIKRNE